MLIRRDDSDAAGPARGTDAAAKGRTILVDSRHFRNVLGSYPTGVSVITSVSEKGERWGLAVGTFSAISLDPPLVGFMPDKASTSWRQIEKTGAFCVNILAAAQLDMCRRFAARGGDKFEGISHGHSPGGLPLLDDVLAWVECGIEKVIELGDHLLVVGAVRALEHASDGAPLLFYRGGYHTLGTLE
jgi:flavin reductase (DIM6/NTAB) family NADH-FMN oxidoreductase RutF